MKKALFAILAVLTIFAMVITGCDDGNKPGGDGITVITLNPTELTVELKGSKQIKATTEPAGAILEWTSSDKSKATVNAGGWVTGVALGEATITATAEDGGKAECKVTITPAVSTDVKVEGDTLVHSPVKLVEANRWTEAGVKGTENEDGSYTFVTAPENNGDGAQYTFPLPKANDTWKLSDYDLVEVHFKTTGGSVTVRVKKGSENVDLQPYPSGSQDIILNSAAANGASTYKAVIEEAGSAMGFQRVTGGPATVAIEKVVFSKAIYRTITFSGGANTGMPAITPVKVLDQRTVAVSNMPKRPRWSGHTFTGWKNTTDNVDFSLSSPITKDITLTAQWKDGDPDPVDMSLDLNPDNWGTLPSMPASWLVGSITWPTTYATATTEGGKLKLVFTGLNRQRAIIPLSEEQIEELIWTDEPGVTFKIVATITDSDGNTNPAFAGFRLHLANPAVKDNWNGTDTGKQTPLAGNTDTEDNHLVEFRPFSSNKTNAATLGYFVIQAMFYDSNNDQNSTATGFKNVTLLIDSVKIELGDTTP